MKSKTITSLNAITSDNPTGFRRALTVCRDMGISDVTLWRWANRGWIKTVKVGGTVMVDLESLSEFNRRAAAGEFAMEPAGAAKLKADKLTDRRDGI